MTLPSKAVTSKNNRELFEIIAKANGPGPTLNRFHPTFPAVYSAAPSGLCCNMLHFGLQFSDAVKLSARESR